jgi:hypothetical protein
MGADAANGQSKWQMAQQAVAAFVGDPRSAGLAVGLQIFPADQPCTTSADCHLPVPFPAGFGCEQHQACVGSAGLVMPLRSCGVLGNNDCAAGTTCAPLGRCSVTGGPCAPAGQPCPGGTAGDSCMAVAKSCLILSGTEACLPMDYATPVVAIGDLPGSAKAVTAVMAATDPGGDTPTVPAVQGALDHLRMRLGAQPNRRAALVLLTDGVPTSCGETASVPAVAMAIGMAASGKPSVPTYAIGVFANDDRPAGPDALASWATAGGTGMPFVLTPTSDLSKQLLDALNQIRGAALPCEYMIPKATGGVIDFNKVNLHYQGAAGAQDIGYVGSAARCDATHGGWYYDVDPAQGTPTRVEVCPATCSQFKADATAQVELRLGCKTKVIQ